MKNSWKSMSLFEKIVWTAALAASVAVIVLSLLKLFDVTDVGTTNWALPLMGILMLLQCAREWKRSKSTAIFSLCAAVFIFVCSAVVFFLK